MPVDPITEQDDTWLIVPLADYPIGVYDIRSGAEGPASDGTEYIDW